MPGPVRTCIGCRKPADKTALLRLVWRGVDGPLPDPKQTEPGRGAYLHRSTECLEQAIKRRALGRALRLSGESVDPTALRQAVEGLVRPAP